MKRNQWILLSLPLLLGGALWAAGQSTDGGHSAMKKDSRLLVHLSDKLKRHMLGNMRDHLETLNAILVDLSAGRMDDAAQKAESRLGMSSMELHGAGQAAPYMPEGMRRAGLNLHKAATRFALKAEEEDLSGAYKALTEVTASCVACHASYRLE